MKRRIRALALALPLLALAGLVPSSVVLGAVPMYFNVLLGGCIAGSVPIEATSVDVVWRNAAGHIKVAFTVGTTNDGTWNAPNWVCRRYHAVSGDTLREHVTQ